MAILVTGAGGFLGKNLLPHLLERGSTVYGLYHKPPAPKSSPLGQVLIGDITKEGLGIANCPPDIDSLFHLAARVDLTDNKKVWETNVVGTRNVLSFMKSHNIPRLLFMSTAYTQHKSAYEISKKQAERDVLSARATQGLKVCIIKPSIIIGSRENPGTDQTINHVALTIAKVYSRVQAARQKVQDTLALPPLELGFRIKGDPQATLNVIPVGVVVKIAANSIMSEGAYYVTNPNPPLLQEVADEVGDALGLNIQIVKEFRSSPPEKLLEKLIKVFLPYMQGEPRFPTIVPDFELPQGHVRDMVTAFLN